jgi:hypothetical protein
VIGLGFAITACAGTARGTDAHADDAVVTIDCPIKDASLWVNGRYVHPISDVRGGIALSPGKTHFIEVKHDRYHTFYAELTLERRERRTLTIRLAQVLP